MERTQGTGVQSLNRSLDILEALALEPKGLSLTELSRRVGLHKSTVHRLLTTLAARGYVELNEGRCRLGLRVVELGSLRLNSMELRTEAAPLLRGLSHRLGRVVHLAIMEEGEVIYLDKVEPVSSIRMYSQIGRRAPFHCTGLGKAMAAWAQPADLQRWIETHGLPRRTANTITDPEALRAELEQIRRRGYAIDDVEHEANIRCIAAPIRDYRGIVIAAVSATGPADEFALDQAKAVAPEVIAVAAAISRQMGYTSAL